MIERLRFVLYSPSIVSEFGNPQATTVRALAAALIDQGHDVAHNELRNNEHVVTLLEARGAEPLRRFNAIYPLLRYGYFEPSAGNLRRVRFSREIGTADAVIAFPDTEEGMMQEVVELDSSRTVGIHPQSEVVLDGPLLDLFDPAVLPEQGASERVGTIAVAYDTPFESGSVDRTVVAGAASLPNADPVAEIDLPLIYRTVQAVRMSEADTAGLALARALLPVAYGAVTELIDAGGAVLRRIDSVDDRHNARLRAARLAETVQRLLLDRARNSR
jgi:hypothetical protein